MNVVQLSYYAFFGHAADHAAWGGVCGAETAATFVEDAVRLYSSEEEWETAAAAGPSPAPRFTCLSRLLHAGLAVYCSSSLSAHRSHGSIVAGAKLVQLLYDETDTIPPIMVSQGKNSVSSKVAILEAGI